MGEDNTIYRTFGRILHSRVLCKNTLSPLGVTFSTGDIVNAGSVALELPNAAIDKDSVTTLVSLAIKERALSGNTVTPDLQVVFLDKVDIPGQGSVLSLTSDVNVLGVVSISGSDFSVSYVRDSKDENYARVSCNVPMRTFTNSNSVYMCVLANGSFSTHASHEFVIEAVFER